MAAEVHQNDIGTIFRVTISDGDDAVDVSSLTTQELIFRKPDGTTETQTSSFYTDGTDGVIQYTSVSGDLDTVGQWKIQANIVMPTGTWRSSVAEFHVHANL